VASAVERGVNYFDVAPEYGDGEAEEKLGPALEPFRADAFLACKTGRRDAAGAEEELHTSLKRLRTDHVDLYQFHGVTSLADVEQITAPDGAAEAFDRARQAGKVRYIGFSTHSVEAAMAMMDAMDVDSILLPVNFVCWSQGNFGPQILQRAKEKGIARLAIKALAHRNWLDQEPRAYQTWYRPIDDPQLAEAAMRFALSRDITAAVSPGDPRLWPMALDIASRFQPLSQTQEQDLLGLAEDLEPIFSCDAHA